MSKRLLTGYLIFSATFLLLLVGWFTIRVVRTRKVNIDAIELQIDDMQRSVVSVYLAEGTFSSPTLSRAVRSWFLEQDGLKALAIHDDGELEYLFSRSPEYLQGGASVESPGGEPESGALPSGLANVTFMGTSRELPDLRYNALSEVLVSDVMILPQNEIRTLLLVATALARADLAPIMRDVIIALLSFLLLTAASIIILPKIEKKDRVQNAVRAANQPTEELEPASESPQDRNA